MSNIRVNVDTNTNPYTSPEQQSFDKLTRDTQEAWQRQYREEQQTDPSLSWYQFLNRRGVKP